jgi:phosphoribosylanthranilate isomerase
MSEEDFKAVCDLTREECAQMTDHQIAILIGLIVHDQDERDAKKNKAS